jgi:glutamate dehydrogenase
VSSFIHSTKNNVPPLFKIKNKINHSLNSQESELAAEFITHYLNSFSHEELCTRAPEEFSESALWCWRYIQTFESSQPKIKIIPPNNKIDHWSNSNTVITILQRDMPFLVDSIRNEFERREINVSIIKSLVMRIIRTDEQFTQWVDPHSHCAMPHNASKETLIYLEIEPLFTETELSDIKKTLLSILTEISTVVSDHDGIVEKVKYLSRDYKHRKVEPDKETALQESSELLDWLCSDNFIFLGYSEYSVDQDDAAPPQFTELPKKRLGLVKINDNMNAQYLHPKVNAGIRHYLTGQHCITHTKHSVQTQVHHIAYPDIVFAKRYNYAGRVIGVCRLLGLYTTPDHTQTHNIPVIRGKIDAVIETSHLDIFTHSGRSILKMLETHPIDELFQSSVPELHAIAVGVAQISERRQTRLFLRQDPLGEFISCMVYIPRHLYSTKVRSSIQLFLADKLESKNHQFNIHLSESLLVRTHFIYRIKPGHTPDLNLHDLENALNKLSLTWDEQLKYQLTESLNLQRGRTLFPLYKNAFSASYRDHFDVDSAVRDIECLVNLSDNNTLTLSIEKSPLNVDHTLRLRLFRLDNQIELSDVIPILENFGLRVIGEHPYSIKRNDGQQIWLHDFTLSLKIQKNIDLETLNKRFESAFIAVWTSRSENDSFNQLVLAADMPWREVALLRTYSHYMKQILFPFTLTYIATTLIEHTSIAQQLIALFNTFFDPKKMECETDKNDTIKRIRDSILEKVDSVSNLDEDRIIRSFFDLINITQRTNFFQKDSQGKIKDYIALKLKPITLDCIPAPRPLYEIFVCSPRLEGVHLRNGKVSRGGIRWSDRLQDYRTEVLGLLKAQQVKNSVIVPTGAKGTFVTKVLPRNDSHTSIMQEGIACYKLFIQGLLDITDNLIQGEVSPPPDVVRRDDDDPYLVVAADKGTATFSDIANEIAIKRDFWLGDAFASGGSNGYDHKAMGITAKGAWIAVQRHFRELNIDIQKEDFSVIGIGDMSGDVFGNGMLLSPHIRLVAAFNHQHIFIDPTPDIASSYTERQRLFQAPQTRWSDYNINLISAGGGIFSRSAKTITLSAEMKKCFHISARSLSPTELIYHLLKAPVDLIWNGGIGTYVKASTQTHDSVGDKVNDNLRVNGKDLRCKVLGEGGNLGITQLGRVEYCLHGGICNTDFIDNAGGVDCSDHEVNIKILLNELLSSETLTEDQRNQLLLVMTDDISKQVLQNNYRQTQAISLAQHRPVERLGEYLSFIHELENTGRLDRQLEGLPEDSAILDRGPNGQSLTRPELCVLISYAKGKLKEELLDSPIPEDPFFQKMVEKSFPERLRIDYKQHIYSHSLSREIITNEIANEVIDNMGVTFCRRMKQSTDAGLEEIIHAYVVAREIFSLDECWSAISTLDNVLFAELQLTTMHQLIRRMEQTCLWLLHNRKRYIKPTVDMDAFIVLFRRMSVHVLNVEDDAQQETAKPNEHNLRAKGVSSIVIDQVENPVHPYLLLGISDAAQQCKINEKFLASLYMTLAEQLGLVWLINQLSEVTPTNKWQSIACSSLIDELEGQLRELTIAICDDANNSHDVNQYVLGALPTTKNEINGWLTMLSEFQTSHSIEFAMFGILFKRLKNIVQLTIRPDNPAAKLAGTIRGT